MRELAEESGGDRGKMGGGLVEVLRVVSVINAKLKRGAAYCPGHAQKSWKVLG